MIGVLSPAPRRRRMTSMPSRSGRVRSSRITSGFSLRPRVRAPTPRPALRVMSKPCAPRLVRSSRRIGGSSSTTSTATPFIAALRPPAATKSAGGKLTIIIAPLRSVRFPARIEPPSASTKPLADREPEPGTGAGARACGTRWNCSKMRSSSSGGMPGPSSITRMSTSVGEPRGADRQCRSGWRIARRIVDEIDQHLLEKHDIERQHGHDRPAHRR